jgi:hypothetical protein
VAVVVYTNPETGYNAWDVPGWCPIYPSVLNLLDACKPPTPAQIQETTLSNMGAAAAANPAVAAKVQAIASAPPTDPFYCSADPQGCADYKQFVTSPTCSALLGTSGICSLFDVSNTSNLLLFAGAALVVLLLVRR